MAKRPEGDAAAQVGRDGEQERDAVAAREIEDPSRRPGAHRGSDARADRDDAEDGAQMAPRKRSAVFAVMAGPRAPQVRPKKQACSQRSQLCCGPVMKSAQTTPTMEIP